MSLGLCVRVRDLQDSICVRFARAGLFCAGSPFLCRIAGPAAFCQVRRILFFPFFRVFRSIMSIVRRGRGTRRACRTLQFDQGSERCAWCLSMGANAPAVCTFKARGRQEMFTGTACVRRACFGHMVAYVWDGSHVRQENKDRLKRLLAMSISEKESEAGPGRDIAQHCWAEHLLDACKYEEIRAGRVVSESCSDYSSCDSDTCDMQCGEFALQFNNRVLHQHLQLCRGAIY